MALFKNKNTWLWVIVFLVVLLLVVSMKKCENMTETYIDCQTCGSCKNCSACISHNETMDKAYYQTDLHENFANLPSLDSQMNIMHNEMNTLTNQMVQMEKEIKSMESSKKSKTSELPGHNDNVNLISAAPLMHKTHEEDEEDEECEDDNDKNMVHKHGIHNMPVMHHMPKIDHMLDMYHMPLEPEPMRYRHHMNRLDELKEKVGQLMERAPEILNKCSPGILQTIGSIAELIKTTDGKLHKLKSVEPSLTNEFHKLNQLLENLDSTNLTCVEKETHHPLKQMMCKTINDIPIEHLHRQLEDLEYVNEMFKSQKYNFRQLRDLFVIRLKELVESCDIKEPRRKHLQLRTIHTISEILNSLGYIFQDDTLKEQERMLMH